MSSQLLNLDAEEARKEYLSFIENNLVAFNHKDMLEVVTPVLNRHNDAFTVYITPHDQGYKISDLGETIADIEMYVGDLFSSDQRKIVLNQIVNGFGIKKENKELFVLTDKKSMGLKKHMLLQAMSAVDDMFYMSKPYVKNLFIEDVENWLMDNEVRYSKNISLPGETGLFYNYEFIIPKTPHKAPERYIKTLNNPNTDKVKSALFSWEDVKSQREQDAKQYIFLNTLNGPVNDKLLGAINHLGIVPVNWPNVSEEIVEQLIA